MTQAATIDSAPRHDAAHSVGVPPELHGEKLHGDDFDAEQIADWFSAEEDGYYRLTSDYPAGYTYYALNDYYGFRHLKGHYAKCLALGCANGEDMIPIAGQVGEFIAVEPAREWWSDTIGGTKANFIAPNVDGTMPVADASVDLVCIFGVLHHIPNVSAVMAEVGRVLKPGGTLLLREPMVSMGDFRQPRRGLTRHERGIPAQIMRDIITMSGMTVEQAHMCMTPLMPLIGKVIGKRDVYNSPALVRLDRLFSWATGWNARYWRPGLLRKLAPTSIYFIAKKAGSPAADTI